MFSFSKFFSFICFGPNLDPKSENFQIDWNFIQGYIATCLLWLWCLFFQFFVIHLILGNLAPSIYCLQMKWNLILGHSVICWLQFWCVIFQSIFSIQFHQFGEHQMEQNLRIIFWTQNFWKIRVFDYNQDIVLITYTQILDSSQLGLFQILGPNLPKITWMTKLLKI